MTVANPARMLEMPGDATLNSQEQT
jgi:hypothetical protein